MDNKRIEEFLDTIEHIFTGMDPHTAWPLKAGQVDAYFDATEAVDMYSRLTTLRKTHTIKEIAHMLPPADIIRLFLQHNAIIGLKVAKNIGTASISKEQRIEYTEFLFDILKEKTHNDIFCHDGKNLLLNKEEIHHILTNTPWNVPQSEKEKRDLAVLTIISNNLCYTLFYDIYMAGGFYIHGPYDASQKFGEGTILLIRDYHNLDPRELWPELNMPYQSLKIYAIYKDLDLKLTFANHPVSTTSIGDKLIAYKVVLDGREVRPEDIHTISMQFEKIIEEQTTNIKAMTDLDKVRKGIEIAYYLFKDFREKTGAHWKPPVIIEQTIQQFGETFIKQFEKPSKDPKFYRKLIDPRIDEYEF